MPDRFVLLDIPDGWPAESLARLPGSVAIAGRGHVGVRSVAERDAAAARGATPWWIAQTPAQVAEGAAAGCGVWLRGLECGGDVEPFTALVLIRAAVQRGARFVVEGLGVRGHAAALAVGAAGIALGSELAVLDEAPISPELRSALMGSPSARDTVVLGELEDRRRRLLQRAQAPMTSAVGTFASVRAMALPDAVNWLVGEVDRRLAAVRADPLPVVQGPMANVAEAPGLGLSVLRAGAMPFVALGALDPERARSVLESARDAFVGSRWGAGVIGFDMAPHRDAHLDLCAEYGVPVVTIAGGSPDLARRLIGRGFEVWLHTPSARLATLADCGAIFEGHEAGGHVGALTSAALWEEGLAAMEAAPRTVVLAGGIGDAASAAFASAMAAGARAAGCEVMLQAGTAFLLSHEAVESGQLAGTGQRMALGASRTLLVGSSVGLPLRVAENEWSRSARRDEIGAEGPIADRRLRHEAANVGRTRIAAKGIERDPQWERDRSLPKYRKLTPARQASEGAHTFGIGATVTPQIRTVSEIVRSMTIDAVDLLSCSIPRKSAWGDVATVGGDPAAEVAKANPRIALGAPSKADPGAPIAVIGIGCVLPGGFSVDAFHAAQVAGRSAIRPTSRWKIGRYWDPDGGPRRPKDGVTRSRLAGSVDGWAFEPLRFGIPPRIADAMDPVQKLALHAAAEALADAGLYDGERCSVDGERAAVILGNSMGGEQAKGLAVRIHWREVMDAVRKAGLSPVDEVAFAKAVEGELDRTQPPLGPNSIAGALGNVIAGRVAAFLDWKGGAFTVDAACASSLAALQIAVDQLRSGRVDVAITGGVDGDLSPVTFAGFSLAGALSSGDSRPFAAGADGFVMGEGCAVFVLQRLDDAIAQNRPVWAVIRGVGQASDGRGKGITAPRAIGQTLAIERALADARTGRGELGLIEAHGTGTSIGDATETEVLGQMFADAPRGSIWLGSVKSSIGHLKGAAGAAGLLRAVLAVATGVVSPTLNAGPVDPELGLVDGPFRLPRKPARLQKRCAGVSAFGFGGTDFHAIVAEAPPGAIRPRHADELAAEAARYAVSDAEAMWGPTAEDPPRVIGWGADSAESLRARIETQPPDPIEAVVRAPVRIVAISDGIEAATGRILRDLVHGPPRGERFKRPSGAHHGQGASSPVVFVVPGQGTLKAGALASVLALPGADEAVEPIRAAIGSALEGATSGVRGAPDLPVADPLVLAETLALQGDVVAAHLALLALAIASGGALARAGIAPAATLGHSVGEIGALVLAGRLSPLDAVELSIARGGALKACPPGAMLAVEGPADALAELVVGVEIAAFNGRRDGREAWVLAGPGYAIDEAAANAKAAKLPCVRLDVPRAYHSALVEGAMGPLRDAIDTIPFTDSQVPCIAASRAQVYGRDPRDWLVQAVRKPVRFADALRVALDKAGPGAAVIELGAGALTRHHDGAAVALDPRPGDHLGPLDAAAALVAWGHAVPDGALLARSRAVVAQPSPAEALADVPADAPRDAIRAAVIGAIAEVTGYPPEHLDRGGDLEAKLGIDSIRRMEILSVLQDRLGFQADERDAGRLAGTDLDQLAAFVRERTSAGTVTAPVRGSATTAFALVEGSDVSSTTGESLRRRVHELLDGAEPGDAIDRAFARCVARERGLPLPSSLRLVPAVAAPIALDAPVVLAVGGASGIVPLCLAALPNARGVLIGRRPAADPPTGFEYVSADARDPAALTRIADALTERFGRIDLVVHGAGLLRDRLAADLDDDDIDAVIGAKLDVAHALFAATPRAALYVAFGSIAAHTGSPGQSVYAAANEALAQLRHPSARTLVLEWSAWEGAGMAAPLARILRSRGVTPIPPEAGSKAFVDALGHEGRVVIAAQPIADPLPWPLVGRTPRGWSIELDPQHPMLDHHRVGRRPLAPAAAFMAALLHASRVPLRVAILAPLFVERLRTLELIRTSDGFAIQAGATIATAAPASLPAAPRSDLVAARPAPYRPDALFHGPSLQVLTAYAVDADVAVAECAADTLPAAIDAIHQLAALLLAHRTGRLGLPVAGDWAVHADLPVTRLVIRGSDELSAGGYAADGTLVLSAARIAMRPASAAPPDLIAARGSHG